jgi:hypothetical protein
LPVIKFGLVFLLLLGTGTIAGSVRAVSVDRARHLTPGVAANERLTATLGAVLFVLLVAMAITVLYVQQLLLAHYMVGFLLIPPVVLKVLSTGYRFARYYMHDRDYRSAGAPPFLLRFGVAPILVLSTVAVFVTGLELWLVGLRFGNGWMTAHTVSAMVFVIAVGLHLIGYARPSAAAALEGVVAPSSRDVFKRRSIVVGALVLGAVLAAAILLYQSPFPSAAAGS